MVHPSEVSVTPLSFQQLFSGLPAEVVSSLDRHARIRPYSERQLLFEQGDAATGVWLVRSGRVKLSVCSRTGKCLVVQIAGPGEILGLGAVLGGKPHEVSAETLVPAETCFVSQHFFLEFLRENPSAFLPVVEHLSSAVDEAYERVRSFRQR